MTNHRERQLIAPDYTGDFIEMKEVQLKNTEARVRIKFDEIDGMLQKPFDTRYQSPLESRFRSSAGGLLAMHCMERDVGIFRGDGGGTPVARAMRGGWINNRVTAVGMGYEIEKFEEYLPDNTVWVD